MARVLQTAAGPARRAELARQAAASTAGPPSTSYLMRLEKLASESDQLVTAADTVIQDIFDAALYAKETGNDGMVAELKASLKTALLKQNEERCANPKRGAGRAIGSPCFLHILMIVMVVGEPETCFHAAGRGTCRPVIALSYSHPALFLFFASLAENI